MTKEEAISIMKVIVHMLEEKYDTERVEEAVDMAIEALQQEPCEDDKPCTECLQYDHEKHNCPHFCHVIKGVLKENPNKLGMWIERFDESGKWYECDQCHTDWGGPVNYCPNCGAKMSEMPTGSEGSDTE